MNNLRLLSGWLSAVLTSAAVCASTPVVMTLDRIFESAEANSVRLRPYKTATEEAVKEIEVARSRRLPDVEASLSLSFIGDGFTTSRDFTDYSRAPIPHFGNGLSLTVTQPVYTGGAITTAIELASLKSTAARFATDLERDNIRFDLTGFYLDIYKFTNRRRVITDNIGRARRVLDDMKARYDQGLILLNDITRYELLLANLELELTKTDNTLNILNHNLVVTAGLPDSIAVVPDPAILNDALGHESEGWWQAEASANAPSLGLARSEIDIAVKNEKLVHSDRLPKIGLKAGWTIDGPILVEVPPINRNLSYWYAGIGVSYNLASLYKTNRAEARSRLATGRAVEQLDALSERISLAIRADYIRYLEAAEELKTREKAVELATRNYSTVLERYSADMALITDMLDAANARLDAEQQLVNARIDIIYYYYKLLFISGKI